MKVVMSKRIAFLTRIKNNLPSDLELHKSKGDWCPDSHWIRKRGRSICKGGISVNEVWGRFVVYRQKDMPLARRLAEVFPDVKFELCFV